MSVHSTRSPRRREWAPGPGVPPAGDGEGLSAPPAATYRDDCARHAAGGRIPILTYHQVSAAPSPALGKYAVTTAAFAAQMRWLARARYTTVGLDALLQARAGGRPLPPRSVVITFDDGFRACVEEVVPILRAHGFTAIFYLVAGLMGGTSRWLARGGGPDLPLLDWAAARELVAAGFTCGAHSVSHPRLADLPLGDCRRELWEGRRLLEAGLGREIRHLAYPHGSYSAGVRALASEAGYLSACSVRVGFSERDDDPLALHRLPVNGDETLLDFLCRLCTARSCRQLVRRVAGRQRAQGMTRRGA